MKYAIMVGLFALCVIALAASEVRECPKCGHIFRRQTGKNVVSWVDWDKQKRDVFFCRTCAPIYDEVEYAEGQYIVSPNGKHLIGGRVMRGFIRGHEITPDGVVVTNANMRFRGPYLIYGTNR